MKLYENCKKKILLTPHYRHNDLLLEQPLLDGDTLDATTTSSPVSVEWEYEFRIVIGDLLKRDKFSLYRLGWWEEVRHLDIDLLTFSSRDKIYFRISDRAYHDCIPANNELIVHDILEYLPDVLISISYETIAQSDISEVVFPMEIEMFLAEDIDPDGWREKKRTTKISDILSHGLKC